MSKSKKKKWSPRSKRRQPKLTPIPKTSEASLESRIQDLKDSLKYHRVRRAFAIAKKLLANPDLPPHYKPLLVKAYELRLSNLLDDGHVAEGVNLYHYLISNHPEWKNSFSHDIRVKLECHGIPLELLKNYEADLDIRRLVDESLRQILVDPALLANHEALPPESPLRREATLIMSVWKAIESGEDPTEVEKLKCISRRSPFNYWRLFLQALAAFYNGNDQFAIEIIQRIPENASVAKGARLVQTLIDRGTPEGRLAKTITEKVNIGNLKCRLEAVDRAINSGNRKKAKMEVVDICKSLTEEGHDLLASDLMASFVLQLTNGKPVYGFLDRKTQLAVPDFDAVIRRVKYHDNCDDKELWNVLIEKNNNQLSAMDKALIYRRIGDIAIRNFLDDDDEFEDPISEKVIKKKIEFYYTQSVSTYPLESTFRMWHNQYRSLNWNDNKILEKWNQDFPENEEALFLLLGKARRKRAVNKVEIYFGKLKVLLKGSPRLAEIEPYIQFERAIFKLKRTNGKNVKEIMNSVPKYPVIITIGRDCLDWIYNTNSQNEKVEIGNRLADHEFPYFVFYCLSKIDPKINGYQKLPLRVKNQFKSSNCLIRSLAEVLKIKDEQWKVSELPWTPSINKALVDRALSPELLAELLSSLRAHCSSFNKSQISTIAMLLTTNGLKRADISTADMLMYRALIYHGVQPSNNFTRISYLAKIDKLLSAAKFCLDQEPGDHQLYRELSHFIVEHREDDPGQNWSRRSLKKLINEEAKVDSLEKLHSRVLTRDGMFPRRMPAPFPDMDIDELEKAFMELIMGRFGLPDDMVDDDDCFDSNSNERLDPPPAKPKPVRQAKSRPRPNSKDHPEFPNLF